MKIVFLIALISTVYSIGCRANAAEAPQKHIGKFSFNWLADPASQKCQLVTADLASKLAAKHFSCAPSKEPTEAGLKPITCSDPQKTSEYLLFNKKSDCDDERKGQAANE